MADKLKRSVIPLDYIRGLIVAQSCRCAISGRLLDPQQVNADHITPLSRTTESPSMDRDNIWLVDKALNAMKGTMTYDELVQMAKAILAHQEQSQALLKKIRAKEIKPITKREFDQWVSDHCDERGNLRT
jgi:hypothetical protein